jgi:hypothetical protein
VRIFVFVRHAESTANVDGVVSSDPARPVTLTHEYALRHTAAAAAPDSWLWPDAGFANAVPYLFDDDAVRRAAASLAAPLAPTV